MCLELEHDTSLVSTVHVLTAHKLRCPLDLFVKHFINITYYFYIHTIYSSEICYDLRDEAL